MERETWQKDMRLRRSADFQQVWAGGRSWAHPLCILWSLPNDLGKVRIGITASRKVGNAVARNRARRLLREAARRLYPRIVIGWDIVLVARAPLLEAREPQAESAMEQLLRRAALWTPREITEQE